MPKRVDTNRVGLNPTEDRTKIYKKCQLILLTLLLLNGMLRRVRLYKKCSIQTGDLVRKIMEVLNLHVQIYCIFVTIQTVTIKEYAAEVLSASKVLTHKTSLTPSLFIEVSVPCQENERSCRRVLRMSDHVDVC